jgi:pimeloyl-ACP methyl ester carboxylesterase
LRLSLAALCHDARAQLSRIQAKTLVLIGEYDPLLTVDSQRVLLAALPHAEYALIDGAGHDLSVEAPEATAARVLAHIL